MAEQVVMSKSAKKRAAKAARDAAYADANPGAPAKAAEAPPVKEAPKEAAPKAASKKAAQPAKADAKSQAKPAAKKKAQDEAALKQQQAAAAPNPDGPPVEWDDGAGGEWGTVKKAANSKEERAKRKAQREAEQQKMIEQERDDQVRAMAAAIKKENEGKKDSKATEALKLADAALKAVKEGKADRIAAATQALNNQKNEAKTETSATAAGATGTFFCTVEKKIGILIGPGGKNLTLIKEKIAGVSRIDVDGQNFTVTGEQDAVNSAVAALQDLYDNGVTKLAYDNYNEVTVMASTTYFPDIIGKQGAIIRKMKEELGVEVKMPNVDKNTPGRHPIKIVGEKEKCEKCKEVIESIMKYYHHEVTHEGQGHEELEVADWAYSFIIGRKGSEMKHIQNNWDVKVYIPRETSENQNVVIVGAPGDAAKAKQYIEKLIENAGKRGTDKRQDKADDHWGDGDDPSNDPVLGQYMYKRRQ
jgi:rRNA processing protein Krr1/Pno1